MARLFVTDINLNKNELQNARIQGLSTAPTGAVTGQVYYNTSDNTMYYYNGQNNENGPWVAMNASTEAVQDLIGSSIEGGVGLTKTYVDATGITTLDLDNTTVTAGSYGSSTAIPTFTVDAQGRLTAAGTVTVATTLSVAAEFGDTDTVNLLTDTLTFAAGEGINTEVSNNTITISGEDASSTNKGIASFNALDFTATAGNITLNAERVQDIVSDQIVAGEGIDVTYDDVAGTLTVDAEIATTTNRGVASFAADDFTVTSGEVTIKNVNLGTQTTGDYVRDIQGTPNEITVAPTSGEGSQVTIGLPDNVEITNNLNVGGNLNVAGTINSINTTQVNIVDNVINLNTDFEGDPTVDAGIRVERGTGADVQIRWNESLDQWQITNDGVSYHPVTRKHTAVIGDGTSFTYPVTHNLGKREVVVNVYDSATYDTVECDVVRTSTSTITLGFSQAPASGAYTVVIVG